MTVKRQRRILGTGACLLALSVATYYFGIIVPKKRRGEQLVEEFRRAFTELEYLKAGQGSLGECLYEKANRTLRQLREEERRCGDFLKRYRHTWGRPFYEYRKWDYDVFRSVYEAHRQECLRKIGSQIALSGHAVFWPPLRPEATEMDAANIFRYDAVLSELVDTLVHGKARELLSVRLPQTLKSGMDPQPYQSVNFTVSVRIVHADLPQLLDSLLSLDRKFLCFLDSIRMVRSSDALPVLERGRPLEEPLITVEVGGRIYLFHK